MSTHMPGRQSLFQVFCIALYNAQISHQQNKGLDGSGLQRYCATSALKTNMAKTQELPREIASVRKYIKYLVNIWFFKLTLTDIGFIYQEYESGNETNL